MTVTHDLVAGDNLAYMDHLHAAGAAQFDVVFGDPPYNTGDYMRDYYDTYDDWSGWMEPRVEAAKRLLKPGGVLAMTIGQDSVGELLVLLKRHFSRVEIIHYQCTGNRGGDRIKSIIEYLVVAHDGTARPDPTGYGSEPCPGITSPLYASGPIRDRAMATGTADRWQYPIYVDPERLDIIQVGGDQPDGTEAVRPRSTGCGTPAMWRFIERTARDMVHHMRAYRQADGSVTIHHLPAYVRRAVDDGTMTVRFGDKPGSFVITSGPTPSRLGNNLWCSTVHYTGTGTAILTNLGCRFLHPKSPYLIYDFLTLFASAPDARILDIFAGSGTVTHAVLLLNAADGGSRYSAAVTLPDESFTGACIPRIRAALTGVKPDGTPCTGTYRRPPKQPLSTGLPGRVRITYMEADHGIDETIIEGNSNTGTDHDRRAA